MSAPLSRKRHRIVNKFTIEPPAPTINITLIDPLRPTPTLLPSRHLDKGMGRQPSLLVVATSIGDDLTQIS